MNIKSAKSVMYVATNALVTGMSVHCHGSRFLLTKCTHDADRAKRHAVSAANGAHHYHPEDCNIISEAWNREITCRAFETEYLGPVYVGACESIPASWRTASRPWIVQGNARAKWAVESDPDTAQAAAYDEHTAYMDAVNDL